MMTKDTEEKKKRHEERIQRIKEQFNKMEPFQTVNDIPEVPIVEKEIYDNVIIPNLIRCGAIPKKDLIVGKTYKGDCRNAQEGVWNGKEFEIKRYKFGEWDVDTVDHFEDDKGYDVFIPIG